MKKLSTFLCALTVAAGAAFSPVFAAPTLAEGDTNTHADLKAADDTGMSQDVNAKSVSDAIYDVDITWGSMAFMNKCTWDPEHHTYSTALPESAVAAGTDGWYVAAEGDNQVTVVNHSNRQITDVIAYTTNSAVVNNVTGTVVQGNAASPLSAPISTSGNTAELNSADVTTIYNAPTKASAATATLTLAGAPDNDAFKTTAGATVGTLSITLTDTTLD